MMPTQFDSRTVEVPFSVHLEFILVNQAAAQLKSKLIVDTMRAQSPPSRPVVFKGGKISDSLRPFSRTVFSTDESGVL